MKKTLSIISAVLILSMVAYGVYVSPSKVYATSAGPSLPSSGVNNTGVGTAAWTTPGNITACDASGNNAITTQPASHGSPSGGGIPTDNIVELVNSSSVIGGTNEARSANFPTGNTTTLTNVSYGGTSDLWGRSWAYSDINSSNFGIVQVTEGTSTGISTVQSNYLVATNFGFSIPAGATINGIQAVYSEAYSPSIDTLPAYVDCVEMTITYTPAVSIGPSTFTIKAPFVVRGQLIVR